MDSREITLSSLASRRYDAMTLFRYPRKSVIASLLPLTKQTLPPLNRTETGEIFLALKRKSDIIDIEERIDTCSIL
jgi:hypothetical protein